MKRNTVQQASRLAILFALVLLALPAAAAPERPDFFADFWRLFKQAVIDQGVPLVTGTALAIWIATKINVNGGNDEPEA